MINLNQLQLEAYPLPYRYLVDVNHTCNYKCTMCVKQNMGIKADQKPIEDFVNIVERLPWAREVQLGCLGDPHFYKDGKLAMDYLNSKKIDNSVTTNGSTVDPEIYRRIRPDSYVYVSIDGGNQESYEKFRKAKLQTVLDNIDLIRSLRKDITVAINYLIFRDTLDSVMDLLPFCAERKIPMSLVYPIFFNKDFEEKQSIFRINPKEVYDKYIELQKEGEKLKVPLGFRPIVPNQQFCWRGVSQPMIAWDGTVYPCDYCYQDILTDAKTANWDSWYLGKATHVPQYQYAMGNIKDMSLIQMWNSDRWKMLRSMLTLMGNSPIKVNLDELIEITDTNETFDHCKVCLARWSRCF